MKRFLLIKLLLLGFCIISLFCCSKNTDKRNNLFLNVDFKNIIDEIIRTDSTSKSLTIFLTDDDSDYSLMTIYCLDYVEDCGDVKSIFNYNNKVIALVDYSDKYTFDSLVNFSKIIENIDCLNYFSTINEYIYRDYNSYSYIFKNNKFFYLNNIPIEYRNDKVILDKRE